MKIAQTSIVLFVSKVLGSAVGFVSTIYIARVLGAGVLGQYALIIALLTWLGIGAKIGFSRAITKRMSEGQEPATFAGAGVVVMVIMMIIMSVLIIILQGQVNAYVGRPIASYLILLLFVSLSTAFVNAALKGVRLVHIYAVLSAGGQALRAILQIALVAIGFGLSGMLFGYVIGYLIAAIIGIAILGLRPSIPERSHISSLVSYAKYAWLGGMRSKAFDTVDIAVLGFFVKPDFIGIYSVAWTLSKFLDTFGNSISSTLFPEMSKISAENNASAVAGLTEDALGYAGLILVPGFVGSLVIGDRLLMIYGEQFAAGTEVLAILIVSLLIYAYTKQLLNALNATNHPDLAFRANLIFTLTNIVLNVIFIYFFGWIGAAVATAGSALIGLVFAYRYASQVFPVTVPYKKFLYQWVAATGMGSLIYGVREIGELYWVASYNELFIALLVSLGSIAYFSVMFVISTSFRNTVINNIPFNAPAQHYF